MSSAYSPTAVSTFFDAYAGREWDRLDRTAHARLIGHLHATFLGEVLRPGTTVLDAGCGAGRFTRQCLEAGAKVTVVDTSRVQLDLAMQRCSDLEPGICAAHEADIRDLSRLGNATFDIVLCYGSVLCYLLDEAPHAVTELTDRLRPGGTLVLSVGSRAGVLRFAVANPKLDPDDFLGRPDYWHIDEVLRTGTLPAHTKVEHPPRHFFGSAELRNLLEAAGLDTIELGTAPGLASGLFERTAAVECSPRAWETLLRLEEATYRDPGLLDAGEFILARGRKPDAPPR